MSQKKPELLQPKQAGRPRNYNKYSYLTKAELAWAAGVIDTAGNIATAKVINTKRQGRLQTYRCIVRGGTRIEHTVKQLGKMLNIEPRDYSHVKANPRYELVINHENLDALMAMLKPYLTLHKYNTYVRAKNQADMTTFKLVDQGWVIDSDTGQLTGPRRVYRGVDFAAIDAFFASNPDNPEKVAAQIKYLLDGVG